MPKAAASKRGHKDGKVRRQKKDPQAPKRPLSAYMHFANARREDVRNSNPGISFGHIGRRLGELWKLLSEVDRAPFEILAQRDKERFEREKAIYNADHC